MESQFICAKNTLDLKPPILSVKFVSNEREREMEREMERERDGERQTDSERETDIERENCECLILCLSSLMK